MSLASWWFKSVILSNQLIPYAGIGEQIAGIDGISFQLVVQLVNVDTQIIGVRVGISTLDFLQQLPLGDYSAGIAYQDSQQAVLDRA